MEYNRENKLDYNEIIEVARNLPVSQRSDVVEDYSAIDNERLVQARLKYQQMHLENKKLRREQQMTLDPHNAIAKSINSARQFIMYAIFYGFYDDEDEYLENNYLNTDKGTIFSRHKLLINHLKKSPKRDDGILLDILCSVVAKNTSMNLETFVKLLSICINFGFSPMREEVYLISNGSMCYVHVNYMALIGYCEKIGLVTQKIILPEVKKSDKQTDKEEDYVEVLLHPKIDDLHSSGQYTYKTRRKDIAPFISKNSEKGSDFYFKKIAVVWALRACFSYKSEIKGVYIKEEQFIEDKGGLKKGKEEFNKAMQDLDDSTL